MFNIPSFPLKIVFFIHLVLTTWASQAFWLPNSYIFYNAFFLLIVLWAIHHKESEEPVLMAMVIDCAGILIDVVAIAVYASHRDYRDNFSFSMAIFNVIMRPISALILYRIMNERITGVNTDFGIPGLSNVLGGRAPTETRGPYEDIDRPGVHSLPQNNYEPFNPRPKGPYASDATLPIPD